MFENPEKEFLQGLLKADYKIQKLCYHCRESDLLSFVLNGNNKKTKIRLVFDINV